MGGCLCWMDVVFVVRWRLYFTGVLGSVRRSSLLGF